MKKRIFGLLILITLVSTGNVLAGDFTVSNIESLGKAVVRAAMAKLNATIESRMACFTNAGYVAFSGESTRILFDIIPEEAPISVGAGNLLPVHCRWDEALWFAFVKKEQGNRLMMTYVSVTREGFQTTEPVDVRVEIGEDYVPLKAALGEAKTSLINLANGWADGLPEDLLQGALYHDHLCCGVASGYFTVRFIQTRLPLEENEKYIYIGAPSWCQDDYIMTPLNLTPGKSGYFTMEYPWSRPWKTADAVYEKLGGIVVRYDKKTNTGTATLLSFDSREAAFKEFVGMPDLTIEWGTLPWLHVLYNRFFLEHLNEPDFFVSVLKEKKLENQNDLDRLINLGANPLAEILGTDEEWASFLSE